MRTVIIFALSLTLGACTTPQQAPSPAVHCEAGDVHLESQFCHDVVTIQLLVDNTDYVLHATEIGVASPLTPCYAFFDSGVDVSATLGESATFVVNAGSNVVMTCVGELSESFGCAAGDSAAALGCN